MKNAISITMMFLFVVTMAVAAIAAPAADTFDNGTKLLAKSDFAGALKQFAAAVKADPKNQEYAQEYSMLRQVIAWRNFLKTTRDENQWVHGNSVVRAYFVSHRLHNATLELDKTVFDRLKSPAAAVKLAQTELSLGKADDAVKTLSGLDEKEATVASRALLGVALARVGKTDAAKKLSDEIAVPENEGAGTLYSVARLHSAAGNEKLACETLTGCFAIIPPSRLAAFKAHAEKCTDFEAIAKGKPFKKALETESSIPESECSGGSSCATCPNRGSCPGSR